MVRVEAMVMKDLCVQLKYDNYPIRVGIINDEVVFSLYDLLCVLGVRNANVTYALRKVPYETYYRATAINNGNGLMVAVTEEGATLALCRLSKVDMRKVLKLLRWMKTVKKEKIKGA
jgi:hypothetical protein